MTQNSAWENGGKAAAEAEGSSTAPSLHVDAPAFHPSAYHSPALSPNQGFQSPEPYHRSAINGLGDSPPGMDRDAFLAGERAAMGRSLQMLLPAQQQLGALSGGLQRLEAQVSQEATHSRQMHMQTAEVASLAQSLQERLDHLERSQLPEMQRQIQHATEAPLSQEFQATLAGLQSAVRSAGLHSSQHNPYSLTGFAIRQLSWLGATLTMYAQKALSKADVAALIFSRKILLDNEVLRRSESGSVSQEELPSAAAPSVEGLKLVCGASLFLAAVETAWQTHSRAMRLIPGAFKRAVQPAQMGLRVLRIATWAATFLLSAVYFRRGCYWVTDTSISSVFRFLQRCRDYRPFQGKNPTTKQPKGNEDAVETSSSSPKSDRIPSFGSGSNATDAKAWNSKEHRMRALPYAGPNENLDRNLPRQRSIFDTPPPSPQ